MKRVRHIISSGILVFYASVAFAQKEASNWWMYSDLLMNSNTHPPAYTVNPQPDFLNTLFFRGTAAISSKDGELIMYTDGMKVYDKSHKAITNGTGLKGGSIEYNGMVIIPKGVNEKEYYIVYTDSDKADQRYKNDTTAYYSIVKMDPQQQLYVSDKNIPILKPNYNVLAATFHSNGVDTWLLLNDFNTSKLYAYLFTECGVTGPVISDMYIPIKRNQFINTFNFSPDGKKLLAWFDQYYVCDFDAGTGKVSVPVPFPACFQNDVCFINTYSSLKVFSPDSKYIYSDGQSSTPASNSPIAMYQYDIANQTTDRATVFASGDFAPFLASNGIIYYDASGWPYKLQCNNKPDDPVNSDNLQALMQIPGGTLYDYPPPCYSNFISSYMDPGYSSIAKEKGKPIVAAGRMCIGDTTRFNVSRTLAVHEYWWDFGDGSTVYNIKNPVHFYTNAGVYTASLVVRYNCQYDTINTTVYVDEPSLPLADETMITCADTRLKAANGFASYTWNTGATNQEIVVSPPGIFTVSLNNACGSYPKKYILNKPVTALYNVITPNGDGNNDELVFTKSNIPLSLSIYNRWGAEVYHNSDYHNDWNGNNLEAGIYYYRVKYEGCENSQSWIEIIR